MLQIADKQSPAESSRLIDMGAGVGKVMWHAGVAACTVSPPDGVESNPRLVKIAERIANEVVRKAPDGAVWKGWPSDQVAINELLEDWRTSFLCPICTSPLRIPK